MFFIIYIDIIHIAAASNRASDDVTN